MALFLNASDPGFAARFQDLVRARRGQSPDVQGSVRDILAAVQNEGDAALLKFTAQFDGNTRSAASLKIQSVILKHAFDALPNDLRSALVLAHRRIASHHKRQVPSDDRYRDETGAELGHRWTPLDSVGLYVPGGKASYPSSVLMNAIPAKVAGVERIVMVSPAPAGEINEAVLAAAHLAGVDEVYAIGGAQAIAALAFGTETIKPVAKIVGPGNAYVAEAKRQVFGIVGIDTVAGPSEVVVVAGAAADPDWLAADLLAQAEHDEEAQAILVTDSPNLAQRAASAVERQLSTMPRKSIASTSWAKHGAVILIPALEYAPALVNALAPEHLELACAAAEALMPQIRNAGAIFLGSYTPEAIGDYVGGSNHVLPTGRAARFASGLGVLDFTKRTSILKLTPGALDALGPATMTFAASEGLDGHRQSVAIRLNRAR